MLIPNPNQNTVKYLVKRVGSIAEVTNYYKGIYFESTIICNEVGNGCSEYLVKLIHKNKGKIKNLKEKVENSKGGVEMLFDKKTKEWEILS